MFSYMNLSGKVALVAGATRGAGRAIALELGRAGAIVYATGRSTRESRSPMNRAETIEETADAINQGGAGKGIAVKVDHTVPEQVGALIDRIREEQSGQLDILVNDIWGGDPLAEWVPFWQHSLDNGLVLLNQGLHTHIITSWYAAPLMVQCKRGLIIEITDGISARYRGALFYDLCKASVNRIALAQAEDLKEHGIAVLALAPGFLRSEAMLDHFKVTEATWRDAIAQDEHFAQSETPTYLARAVVALASDPKIMEKSGKSFATWTLFKEYGFTDLDGSQPDWGTYAKEKLGVEC